MTRDTWADYLAGAVAILIYAGLFIFALLGMAGWWTPC